MPTADAIQRTLAQRRTIDLTTTGRRSGAPHRVEIVFHNIDGRLYISGTPSSRKRDWIRNLESNPHLTFHPKGAVQADLPGTARVITGEAERRTILAHVARNWGRDEIEAIVGESPLIEVTLDTIAG